jgi:hypothetical protein
LAHMIWQMVATGRASRREHLRIQLNVPAEAIDAALVELVGDGRVVEHDGVLSAESLHIPVGSELGWEAAVSDHFRAVATAIAAKLKQGRSSRRDIIGGGTLSFTVYPGHPFEQEVYALLQNTRARVGELWKHVAEHNSGVKAPESAPKITFYFGQNVTGLDIEGGLEDEEESYD